MDIRTVIKKNEAAWHDVSRYWKDDFHKKYAIVQADLHNILERLYKVCKQLENETSRVQEIFRSLEDV